MLHFKERTNPHVFSWIVNKIVVGGPQAQAGTNVGVKWSKNDVEKKVENSRNFDKFLALFWKYGLLLSEFAGPENWDFWWKMTFFDLLQKVCLRPLVKWVSKNSNFCRFWSIFDDFWRFSTIFDNFWQFLQNFREFLTIFENFGGISGADGGVPGGKCGCISGNLLLHDLVTLGRDSFCRNFRGWRQTFPQLLTKNPGGRKFQEIFEKIDHF